MHLVKLCVGAESLDDLAAYQAARLAAARSGGTPQEIVHRTRQSPKKHAEVVRCGSLYWVIKGVIRARQKILALRAEQDGEGRPLCAIVLDPELVETRAQPRRPFQGWRYLKPEDAPADLRRFEAGEPDGLPPALRAELAELALI